MQGWQMGLGWGLAGVLVFVIMLQMARAWLGNHVQVLHSSIHNLDRTCQSLALRVTKLENEPATADKRVSAVQIGLTDLEEAFKRLQGRFYQQKRAYPPEPEGDADPAVLKNRLRQKAGLIPRSSNAEETT